MFNPPLGTNMVLVVVSPETIVSKERPQEEDGDDAALYLAGSGVALTAVAQRVVPESCRWRHRA